MNPNIDIRHNVIDIEKPLHRGRKTKYNTKEERANAQRLYSLKYYRTRHNIPLDKPVPKETDKARQEYQREYQQKYREKQRVEIANNLQEIREQIQMYKEFTEAKKELEFYKRMC